MPVRTPDDLLEQTTGRSRTFLGSGNFGEVLLFPDARRSLVVKRMKSSVAKSFDQADGGRGGGPAGRREEDGGNDGDESLGAVSWSSTEGSST